MTSNITNWEVTFNTSCAQNIYLITGFATLFSVFFSGFFFCFKSVINGFFILFLMWIMRIWFSEVVTLKYSPWLKCEFLLLVFTCYFLCLFCEFGFSKWWLFSTSHAQHVYSHCWFSDIVFKCLIILRSWFLKVVTNKYVPRSKTNIVISSSFFILVWILILRTRERKNNISSKLFLKSLINK